MQETDVSIVMPCLNEVDCLGHCIANAKAALDEMQRRFELSGEVVIADNGSTDGSQALAESLGARVVHVRKPGYGAALIGGFDAADGRFLVMGDADGSYDFTDSVAMIERLQQGAELCMGSRFDGEIKPGAMPWKNRHIGNPALTGILNLFFRTGINDAHCGLRAIRKDAYQRLGLRGSGMEFASEMVIKASLKRLRVEQVPATLSPDLRQRPPHLRPWRDGWRHLRYLFMLSPTWAFGVPALVMMVAGLLIFLAATLHLAGLLNGPMVFGESWAILAGFLITTGQTAILMQVATHLYGVHQGYRELNPWFGRLARFMTLEHALIIGLVMAGVSAIGLAIIGWWWSSLRFAALPTTIPLVATVTVGVAGIQTVLGGLLFAVIAGNEAQFGAVESARDAIPDSPTGSQ